MLDVIDTELSEVALEKEKDLFFLERVLLELHGLPSACVHDANEVKVMDVECG